MLVGCCIKCKYLDLVEAGSEGICPQCGGKVVSLEVDANKWNSLDNDEMLSLIESAVNKAKTPIKPVIVQPVFKKEPSQNPSDVKPEHADYDAGYDEEDIISSNIGDIEKTKPARAARTTSVAKRVTADYSNTKAVEKRSRDRSGGSKKWIIIAAIAAAVVVLGIGGFLAYRYLGYVEITLPKAFVEDTSGENLKASITEGIEVTINDDGSATYRIPKYKHKALMKELDENIEKALTDMTSSSDALFTSITHNSDYTEFKATCKTDDVGLLQSLSCIALYYCGGFYNVFNGTPVDNVKVIFLDPSGNVITEANSKDMGGKNSSVPVDNSATQTEETTSAPGTDPESDTSAQASATELTVEQVDAKCVAFKDYFGNPTVSAYVAFKNTSDRPITLRDVTIDYEDDNGKLISTDTMPNCIPQAIKPGQVGYLYSYYHDLTNVDLSNGLSFKPNANIVEANGFYEIEVSDVSANTSSSFLDVSVIGRGTNNTGEEQSLAQPGAIYFDKDNNVVGFCYGIETFPAGQTKSFEISGDMLSEDYDKSIVDHVDVYIQGCSWW